MRLWTNRQSFPFKHTPHGGTYPLLLQREPHFEQHDRHDRGFHETPPPPSNIRKKKTSLVSLIWCEQSSSPDKLQKHVVQVELTHSSACKILFTFLSKDFSWAASQSPLLQHVLFLHHRYINYTFTYINPYIVEFHELTSLILAPSFE